MKPRLYKNSMQFWHCVGHVGLYMMLGMGTTPLEAFEHYQKGMKELIGRL